MKNKLTALCATLLLTATGGIESGGQSEWSAAFTPLHRAQGEIARTCEILRQAWLEAA